ncbi:MAG: outer membrane protein assembly factor BamA, partial [Desulfobacteraceae bacterium]
MFLVLSGTGLVHAEKKVAIGIFPVSVLSDQPNQMLGERISLMLAQKLEEEGIKCVFLKDQINTDTWSLDEFRSEGIKTGADFMITGSAFLAGESISIDTRMIPVYGKSLPITFFAEALSFENLLSAVSDISKEVISVVFKKKIIASLEVTGNSRVESDAIKNVIETQVGDIFKKEKLSKDLGRIHKMGYFETVTIKREDLDTGVEIVFEVKEKPSVRRVKFEKNHRFDKEDFTEVISTRTGSILNIFKLNEDMARMKLLYTEKNYHNCSIAYEIVELENNQADVIFRFDEGDKLRIENISFIGNKQFDDDDLKDEMESSEKGMFYWITSSGDLDEIELKNDAIRIESFYKNNGYVDAQVSDPKIVFQEKGIEVSFEIREGDQYTVKQVEIKGDLIIEKEALFEEIETVANEVYNRETIRKDVISLGDIYANKGFANADIRPMIVRNEDQTIDITFAVKKGSPVYIERVLISGNLKTRDKVIRREIKAQEQSLYSKKNIQRSFKNLTRLDYFEKVDIEPRKTQVPDRLNLLVDVIEKNTGSFSFGGGYSGEDGAFVALSIQERNLFGKGWMSNAKVQIGEDSNEINIGFTEPWLFDIPLSAGFDIYKVEYEYDHYDKDTIGLQLRA